jgi:hypothetical protein
VLGARVCSVEPFAVLRVNSPVRSCCVGRGGRWRCASVSELTWFSFLRFR